MLCYSWHASSTYIKSTTGMQLVLFKVHWKRVKMIQRGYFSVSMIVASTISSMVFQEELNIKVDNSLAL